MRTLVIGDIHGHLTALRAVLAEAAPRSDDRIVLLGDYVNGGPDSAGVLDHVVELHRGLGAICLRGNHDDIFQNSLAAAATVDDRTDLASFGLDLTYRSYPSSSPDAVPASHKALLASLRDSWHDDRFICVHARIDRSADPSNPDPMLALWGHVRDAEPHDSGRTVICGHASQSSGLPLDLGHTVCIDTAIKKGGWLTLLSLPDWTVIQSNARGEIRSSRLRG